MAINESGATSGDVTPKSAFEQKEILIRHLSHGGISDENIKKLADLAHFQECEPDTVLLTEGKRNTKLFFLVHGEIRVLTSGETIATLSTPGDILGEMSLITGNTCAATGVTTQHSTLLAIDLDRLAELPSALREQFRSSMNQLFCVILADKLAATNEKARLFEITNRELQRTQQLLEDASMDRISEFSLTQQQMFKQLNSILKERLSGIATELEDLSLTKAELPQPSAIACRIRRLISELEPFRTTLEEKNCLQDKNILLAESDIQQQVNVKLSLGSAGVKLTVVDTLAEGKAALEQQSFDVVCVTESFEELIPFARALNINTKFVLMTSKPISEQFNALEKLNGLSTIIARHPEDRLFTVKNTATTIRKLVSGDIFGASKYLGWGTELRERKVTHSSERMDIVAEMDSYFEKLGVNHTLRRKCERVAEELLMNVVYDAPTDDFGKPLYNHLSRTVPVALAPSAHATFRYGSDGAFLAVAVEDPFGSLKRETISKYLRRCFNGEIDSEDPAGTGGGGNGLFQLIQSASLVVFNVQPRVRTEVIALQNINVQMNRVTLFPSFHYFDTK